MLGTKRFNQKLNSYHTNPLDIPSFLHFNKLADSYFQDIAANPLLLRYTRINIGFTRKP
ncbi:hypothetical protein [Oceanobacillus massiliensis]|uniref:hypothetical protein n=1 Tax=Oceanobacillus massiliensis TaxID=1465765 RepID=UPI000300146D|nr:hypothetical protein [Oceanobacillus massiliensis]